MQRLVRALKKIYASDYFPFIILLFFMGLLHCFIGLEQGDDPFFSKVLNTQGIGEYLQFRYFNWTSRVLIEAVMVAVLRNVFIWRILDLAAVMLLALSLSKLVDTEKKRTANYLVCIGFLIYPFIYMNTAGWGATTINYLWPAAACAFALIPSKKAVCNEPVSIPLAAAAVLAAAFAANAEQCAFFLAGILVVLNIYLYTRKKPHPVLILQGAVVVAGLVFILTCPGNANRFAAETVRWYPDYGMLGLWDKLYLGVGQTAGYTFGTHNRLFLLLSGVLLITVWQKRKGSLERFIAVLPFLFSVFANIPVELYKDALPQLQKLLDFGLPAGDGALSLTRYAVMFFAMLNIFFVCISLNNAYGKTKKSAFFILLFLAGLASGVMIGFSPTVHASGLRVFFNTDMVFLVLGCWLTNDLLPHLTVRQKRLCYAAFAFLALMSFYYTVRQLL